MNSRQPMKINHNTKLQLRGMKINNHWQWTLHHFGLKVFSILDIKALELLFFGRHVTFEVVVNIYGWIMWVMCFPK